jgi:hypothetical protein
MQHPLLRNGSSCQVIWEGRAPKALPFLFEVMGLMRRMHVRIELFLFGGGVGGSLRGKNLGMK